MHRAAVLLRTALLAALTGLLCIAPAAAARPSSHPSVERHGSGWTTPSTHDSVGTRDATAPTVHRAGPRTEDSAGAAFGAVPLATGPGAPAGSLVTADGADTSDAPHSRAPRCPKMRAPPT